MDGATRRTIYSNLYKTFDTSRGDNDIHKRGLITLLRANAEIERERSMYRNHGDSLRAMLMVRPGDSKKAFAMFGLIFGSLPLLTASAKIAVKIPDELGQGALLWSLLFAVAGVLTGITGFALGRLVPGILHRVSDFRLPNRIVLISLIGFCWGAIAGAAGGFFLFIIGAIVGAILGGLAGSVAVPLFVLLHSTVRAGDLIERRHFLPVAFGITLTLCAYILGL